MPPMPLMPVEAEPQDQEPIPLMTVSRDVVLPLGVVQALVLMIAVAVACIVLVRRHPPDEKAPDR
jgi:hypothetical protein